MNINDNLFISIKAAIEAGIEILKIYETDFNFETKGDASPLTLADLASNKVINRYLVNTGIPIISEENKLESFEIRNKWSYCWLVDPLDGTKEFIKKNGEFTVNIALVNDGIPLLGVIFVPFTRELYYADVNAGKTAKWILDENFTAPNDLFSEQHLLSRKTQIKKTIRIVGSRSHMNEDTKNFIESQTKFYEQVEVVSKGSSLKFCLVAEGLADVYPRFGPTMEWDTAAGHALCMALGYSVMDNLTNQELKYNKVSLLNNYFIVQ